MYGELRSSSVESKRNGDSAGVEVNFFPRRAKTGLLPCTLPLSLRDLATSAVYLF
jgi:hypothetical protein